MSFNLDMTDLFCGAGGSTSGALQVPGMKVKYAANHWALAIETHNANHPDTDHLIADISATDPRSITSTDLLWASPECTNHSRAKGSKRIYTADQFGDELPNEAADRSRATMWDVARFAEVHHYRAIIVENVVEVVDWAPDYAPKGSLFNAWINTMFAMGYLHKIVSLNSMHAQAYGLPAPQSRDRAYVVFWRIGEKAPDLERMQRPLAWCPTCDELVNSLQHWKKAKPAKAGRYGQQYVYRCPKSSCRTIVEPGWLPALSFIDLANRGQRIGDRDKPLADKTMMRIEHGVRKYWEPLIIEAAGNTYDAADPKHVGYMDPASYWRAWAATDPIKTIHASMSKALILPPLLSPAGGTWNDDARSAEHVARTRTTRESEGVVMPPVFVPVEGREGKSPSSSERTFRTQSTRSETGLMFPPLIAELRGGGSKAREAAEALATVTASGNHHALVTSYYGTSDSATSSDDALPTVTTVDRHALLMRNNTGGAEMTTPAMEVARTMTTAGHQSLLSGTTVDLDDVYFRMLEPSEIKQAMAFTPEYEMRGNRREQVKQSGNAVTPPSSRDLVSCVAEAITGEAA